MKKVIVLLCFVLLLSNCGSVQGNRVNSPISNDDYTELTHNSPDEVLCETSSESIDDKDCSITSFQEISFQWILKEMEIAINIIHENLEKVEADIYNIPSEGTHIIGLFTDSDIVQIESYCYGSIGKLISKYYFSNEIVFIIEEMFIYEETINIDNEPRIIENNVTEYVIYNEMLYRIEREDELIICNADEYTTVIQLIDSYINELINIKYVLSNDN
jgi:hypothetical protein